MSSRNLRDLLRTQNGVLSAGQATRAGVSRAAIRDRVASGEWVRVAHLVYRAADHPPTPKARVRAAMLSVGDDATLVGRAAAWWWKIGEELPDDLEIAVPPHRHPRPRQGVQFWRRPVAPGDRLVLDGVQVTKKAPTVLAASVALALPRGAQLMDRALQNGSVTIETLRAVHLRNSGRWGSPLEFDLIALADGGARSEAERLSHVVLQTAGVEGWVANLEIALPNYGRAIGDIVFPGLRIVVEVDGWAYHRDLRAFLHDAARQNALVAAGWTVLRTNWYELRGSPHVFLGVLRKAIGTRSALPARHAHGEGRLATRKPIMAGGG